MVNVYSILTDLLPKEVFCSLQCINISIKLFKGTIFLADVYNILTNLLI